MLYYIILYVGWTDSAGWDRRLLLMIVAVITVAIVVVIVVMVVIVVAMMLIMITTITTRRACVCEKKTPLRIGGALGKLARKNQIWSWRGVSAVRFQGKCSPRRIYFSQTPVGGVISRTAETERCTNAEDGSEAMNQLAEKPQFDMQIHQSSMLQRKQIDVVMVCIDRGSFPDLPWTLPPPQNRSKLKVISIGSCS